MKLSVSRHCNITKTCCTLTSVLMCTFFTAGCESAINLSELGSHTLECPHKPTGELDAKVRMKD